MRILLLILLFIKIIFLVLYCGYAKLKLINYAYMGCHTVKFEEAFHSETGSLIAIQEIEKIYKLHPKVFAKKYNDNLYCPECRQARLTYVNRVSPYYRTFKQSIHSIDCTLAQDVMDKQVIKTFVENPNNNDQIAHQLDRVIRTCLKNNDFPKGCLRKTQSISDENSNSVITNTTTRNSNRIPQKRIDNFNPKKSDRSEFLDCYKLFYGIVNIKWESVKTESDIYYKLLLYSQNAPLLICRIRVSQAVYQWIDPSYRSLQNKVCYVSFLAKFASSYDEKPTGNITKSYLSTTLLHSNYLRIVLK